MRLSTNPLRAVVACAAVTTALATATGASTAAPAASANSASTSTGPGQGTATVWAGAKAGVDAIALQGDPQTSVAFRTAADVQDVLATKPTANAGVLVVTSDGWDASQDLPEVAQIQLQGGGTLDLPRLDVQVTASLALPLPESALGGWLTVRVQGAKRPIRVRVDKDSSRLTWHEGLIVSYDFPTMRLVATGVAASPELLPKSLAVEVLGPKDPKSGAPLAKGGELHFWSDLFAAGHQRSGRVMATFGAPVQLDASAGTAIAGKVLLRGKVGGLMGVAKGHAKGAVLSTGGFTGNFQNGRLIFSASAHNQPARIDVQPNGQLQYRPGFDGFPLAALTASAAGERGVAVPQPAPPLPYVLSIDAGNAKAHHTMSYQEVAGGPKLVRRGQAVTINVALPAELAPQLEDFDGLLVGFAQPGSDTELFGLGVQSDAKPMPVKLADGRTALVLTGNIALPGDTAVGSWQLRVRHYDNAFLGGESDCDLAVLFNPYRPKLPESLPESASPEDIYGLLDVRTEPLTAPTAEGATVLWEGAAGNADAWLAALAVVDAQPLSQRREPLPVAKAIAATVRGGSVVRWATPSEQKEPWEWTSSSAILAGKKGNPVKYGQCWVFSGVALSMNRAMGIPSRPMTNLNSAHERQQAFAAGTALAQPGPNACVTTAVDAKGDTAVWNFHVWNEGFQNPGQWLTTIGTIDSASPLTISSWGQVLEKQAPPSSWNAFDATPQEISEGKASAPLFGLHIGLADKWVAVAPWVEATDLGFAALDSKSEPAQTLAAAWTKTANTQRYWLFEGCYKYEIYQAKACVANVTRSYERKGRLAVLSGLAKASAP